MIRGYAEQPSPRAGEEVVLRVATDAPRFRVELHRYGAERELVLTTDWLEGQDAPLHLPFQDWGRSDTGLRGEDLAAWRAHRLRLPDDCRSGVHVALLVEGDADGRELTHPDPSTPDGRDARALVVVRPGAGAPTADVLYKVPVLTYFAYDLIDGQVYDPATARGHWCLYNLPRPSELPVPVPPAVGLHRPGGGTGGWPYDVSNTDPFDPTPRQTYVHWDARMVGFLEREGFAVDYCTDVDLHRDGTALLAPYALLVSAGHDEYWSAAMRDAVEGFVAGGGNAAFFGGNTCWWQVEFADEVSFSRRQFWHEAGRPENSLLGVSFRNGGERDRDDFPVPVGFRVQHADHWVWAGTGVRDGDVVGGGPGEYVVGYECDGAEFDRADLEAGRPVRPTGQDGTPADFTILGVGDVLPHGWGFGNGAATMGLHTPGGTVFTGATTDWPRVLESSPTLARVTRNVVERLSRRGQGRRG